MGMGHKNDRIGELNSFWLYKALHDKVSINYVDKINRMLTLWTGPFMADKHIVNKNGRVSLADATCQISRLLIK